MIALNISIDSKSYTLINVYAPNDDSPDFFDSISDIINEFDNSRVLIVGDYNLVSKSDPFFSKMADTA